MWITTLPVFYFFRFSGGFLAGGLLDFHFQSSFDKKQKRPKDNTEWAVSSLPP
jgi:hypothetical protein